MTTGETDSTSSLTPRSLTTDPRWERAACKGRETELWFATDLDRARTAVRVCNACPIKDLCFDYAIENDEYGIWGGHAMGGMKIEGLRGVPLGRVISSVCRSFVKVCPRCKRLNKKNSDDYPLFTFKRPVDEERNQRIRDLYAAGTSVREIINQTNLSPRQVYRILKEGNTDVA